MRKVLTKAPLLYHVINGKKITGPSRNMSGNCSWLRGNCTGLRGNCSGLSGDIDAAEISDAERKAGIDIKQILIDELV